MVSAIALVRAPNPSPMTLTGTNSYVLDAGNGEALVIDPEPGSPLTWTQLPQTLRSGNCGSPQSR